MSLESKISALTIAIENLTAQMQESATGKTMLERAHDVVKTAGDVLIKGDGITEGESSTEKASQADSEMAEKINAEAKKKALAESKAKAKAKKEAEKLKALAEEDAKDDAPGQEAEVSADDLKAACLTAARAEEGNKVKVKKLLASYDATVVKDVAPGDRAEILAKLEAGEF